MMKFFDISSSFKIQLLTACSVNVITFSHGIMLGWLSVYILLLQSEQSPLLSGPVTVDEISWIGAMICVGGFLGNFLYGFISEKWGKQRCLLLLPFPQIVFWLMVYLATDVYHLYIARICAGITGGGLFVSIPLFIAAIAEPNIRGTIGSVLLLSYNIGILFAYTIGLFIDYYTFPLVMISFPILFFIIISFFPETPQCLLEENRENDAKNSIKFYRGIKKNDELTKIVLDELERMKMFNTKKNLNQTKLEWKDFCNKEAIRGITIGIFLMIFNQMSGCFAIINYSSRIFKDSGTNIDPGLASIIVAILQIFGSYGSSFLADRIGRKILLVISTTGCTLGLFIMGLFSYLSENNYNVSSFKIVPVLCLSFVVFIASLGILTIPFVVLPEILPSKIRSIGSSISLAVLPSITFIILKFFPVLSETLRLYGCMWIFSLGCLLGTIFIILIIPETNGKILDEIQLENKSTERNVNV